MTDLVHLRPKIFLLRFVSALALILAAACGNSNAPSDTAPLEDGSVPLEDGSVNVDATQDSSDADMELSQDGNVDGGDAADTGTPAITTCSVNEGSLANRNVGEAAARYRALLDKIEVPAVSQAPTDGDDLVVTRNDLIEPTMMKLVVRKPTSTGGVRMLSIPNDPIAAWVYMQNQFEAASEAGDAKIVFPANESIRLANQKAGGALLPIEGLRDVIIDLNGSTLEYTQLAAGLVIKDCQRLVIKNGTIRAPYLIATIAIARHDQSPAGIGFEPLPQFVAPLESLFSSTGNRPNVLTVGKAKATGASWQLNALGNADLFANRGGELNRFVYRYANEQANGKPYFQSASGLSEFDSPPFADGEMVYLLHQNNSGHAIVLKNDDGNVEDISFLDIDLLNIPGMGISGEVNRGIHVKNLRVVPDPNNPLSFLGSSSDGFHVNNNGGDILFEDNEMGGSADDLFTAKGNWWRVNSIDRRLKKIEVGNADSKKYSVQNWAMANERVIFTDERLDFISEALMNAPAKELGGRSYELTLKNLPVEVNTGLLVANPDRAGGRIIIRNNSFSNSRAQGVLAQAQHVIIEHNRFENIAGPAVKINFSPTEWFEGVSVRNVLVSNNTFKNTAVSTVKSPHSIYLRGTNTYGASVDILEHIRIETNSFGAQNEFGICLPYE